MKINSKDFRVRPAEKVKLTGVAHECEAGFRIEEGVSDNSWKNTWRS